MAKKLVTCEHCEGTKTCTVSGGRSCKACLKAAGRSIHQWATVRCSYCGGIGKVWVEVEEDTEEDDEQASEEETPEAQ
ncbi:MAG: hypothetical protein ACLFWB_02535 [Armatimonadota bacterium]